VVAQWLNTHLINQRSRLRVLLLAPGERKWQKRLIVEASGSSTVVEHSSHLLKIKTSRPAIGTGREEMATKSLIEEASGSSTLVEHLSHKPKIKGSSPAIGTGREEMATKSLIERPAVVA
jgi:hypothetical protein